MNSDLPPLIDTLAIGLATQGAYDNRVLTTVNDHEVRMSVMTQPFDWHVHPDTDETFIVLEGELILHFAAGETLLRAGQMLTVPRGLPHRTRPAGQRSINLTVERTGAATTFVEAPAS